MGERVRPISSYICERVINEVFKSPRKDEASILPSLIPQPFKIPLLLVPHPTLPSPASLLKHRARRRAQLA